MLLRHASLHLSFFDVPETMAADDSHWQRVSANFAPPKIPQNFRGTAILQSKCQRRVP
jgi:hypothetical protein